VRNAVDTGYLEREGARLNKGSAAASRVHFAGACAAILTAGAESLRRDAADPHSPWAAVHGWSLSGPRKRLIMFRDKSGSIHAVTLVQDRGHLTLGFEGESASFGLERVQGEKSRFAVTLGDARRTLTVLAIGENVTVFDGPDPIKLALVDPFEAADVDAGVEAGPVAPMPGTIIALIAKPGEVLDAGAPMLILEAMKMEHTLRFPARGQVARYYCSVGDFVAEGAALVEFEAEKAA
jgi:3-methylcrotonyl-CoA carboxylase alpha subunit